MKKNIFFLLLYFIIAINQLAAQSTPLDPATPSDWTKVGYARESAIPRAFNYIINVKNVFGLKGDNSTDDAAALQQAINKKYELYGNQFVVFYFPAGTYRLDNPITISSSASRLVFIGQGSTQTVFKATHSGTVFKIESSNQLELISVPTGNYLQYNRGSNYITIPFTGVQPTDFLEIQIKDGSWHGNYHPDNTGQVIDDYVGQIVEVANIISSNGFETNVTLKDYLRLNYGWENGVDSGNLQPKVQKLNSVNNIGFENFSIINEGVSGNQSGYNFNFNYAINCWVWGVQSEKPYRAHVNISRSSGIEIRGCYFFDAKEFGHGGEGYGVAITNHSTNCLVEDNVFYYLRHAMMVAGGANGNVFGYNFSGDQPDGALMDGDIDNGDISFHGHYPYENLFEGNMALFADADRWWGSNGPFNVLFRNQLRRTPIIICFNLYNTTLYPSNNGGIRILGPYVGGVWQPQKFYVFGNTVQYGSCGSEYIGANYFTFNEAPQNSNNFAIGNEGGEAGYSMYYTSKPTHFLTGSYTWPPVGVKRGGASLTQLIPARNRYYNETIKTVASTSYTGEQVVMVALQVDQKRENASLITGSVINRWENNTFQNYTIQSQLPSFTFPSGTLQTFRGEQAIVNNPNEKYNQWRRNSAAENDVSNHHIFRIQTNDFNFTSQFKATHNATIQAQLLEGGNPNGSIDFKDPWLIDYSDPNFNNNLRNQGMSAPFKSVAYSTYNLGLGTEYKGVFLNQGLNQGQWVPPYYSVNAPLTQTINGITSYFLNWSGSNVTFQNPFAQQTGIVFNVAGATATANYKGHLITNSTTALASNGQRKIIQDDYDALHLVYESGGNIYHSRSIDGGSSWSPEIRVNATFGGCFSPSITFNQNRTEHLIAWLQDIQGVRYAIVAQSYSYGEDWTQIYPSITAPNAQQLQISSMTAPSSSPDLLVWREGTSKLKGTLRRYNQYEFGVVRNLRLKDYNYINGFSLGAFGRTNRWDLLWTENNELCYSSIYDDATLAQPIMDFGVYPAVVATGGDWENQNPSVVKNGNTLAVAWESYYFEIEKRNIKVVTITPNLPSYPTIGTATVFTDNQSWITRYYTPSISSHSNNDLSLSWRNGTSAILSSKRVNGSWQSVVSLGTGIDPSASERITNTQNSSLHFRRGTTLPYALTKSTITTSTGGGLEKSGSDNASLFAGEGREIIAQSAKGTSSFVLLNAKSGSSVIQFADVDEAKHIDAIQDIRSTLQSRPFVSNGDLSVELAYNNYGELPPMRKVRILLEEVNAKGSSIRSLGIAKEYEGVKKSNEALSFIIPKTENPVRIIIDPVLRDDSMRVEISKWYVVDAAEQTLEKSGKEMTKTKIIAPAVLDLLQNYPNPFNPLTTIEFTVPKDGAVKLAVYNSLGQVVAILHDGFAQSGYVQKATFDGSNLSSGVYFSRLEYEGKSIMKKLMLLK